MPDTEPNFDEDAKEASFDHSLMNNEMLDPHDRDEEDDWADDLYPDEEDESDYEDSLGQRQDYLEEKIQALTDRVMKLELVLRRMGEI